MMTKHFFTAAALTLICVQALADDGNKIARAKLNEATVFSNGAELSHTATAYLNRGENKITIEGLSPNIDRNSIQIKISNNVIISSFEYSTDFLSGEKKNSASQKITDSIDFYTSNLNKTKAEIKINTDMLTLLNKGVEHSVSVEKQPVTTETITKNIEYYRTKSLELQSNITKNENKQKETELKIAYLRQQLNQDKIKNNKRSGILTLTLNAPMAGTANFAIKYFTRSASWRPIYDITIASADSPIDLTMKSKVSQTTGMDWNDVKLTLSTGTPSNGKIAPVFNAWFLQEKTYMQPMYNKSVNVQNSIAYDKPRAEMATVVRGASSVNNSKQPLYVINGTVVDAYEAQNIDSNAIANMEVLKGENAISLYGSRASNGVIVITTKTMEDYITQDETQLSRVFAIDLPYSIPGNGKEQTIQIDKKHISSVTYKYYCAPKLDTETFLIADIANWHNLNLLSGTANITFDGTYIGQTQIDASSTNKIMSLTLGVDKRISVKREKLTDYSSVKFLGTDNKMTLAYKITVRSNQSKTVKFTLKEQYPLSTNKNITVELIKEKTTPWTTNREDIGVLTWDTTLEPGQTQEYIISFSAKYPKGMDLNLQ